MGTKSKQAHTDHASFKSAEANLISRRETFLAQYRANPCNFLPGEILRHCYKMCKNQRSLQATAADWIDAYNKRMAEIGGPAIAWARAS
jgi:hypothetical protein